MTKEMAGASRQTMATAPKLIDVEAEWGKLINQVCLRFLSLSENVALARTAIAGVITNAKSDRLDMTLSQLEEIKVAISEAVSNCIIHGYQNAADQWIELNIYHYDNVLLIDIIDEGVGIPDIVKAMEPNYSTELDRLGLGFAFMNSFMDQLIVKSVVGEGTKVTLIKNLPLAEM